MQRVTPQATRCMRLMLHATNSTRPSPALHGSFPAQCAFPLCCEAGILTPTGHGRALSLVCDVGSSSGENSFPSSLHRLTLTLTAIHVCEETAPPSPLPRPASHLTVSRLLSAEVPGSQSVFLMHPRLPCIRSFLDRLK